MKKAQEYASEMLVVYADCLMSKDWDPLRKKISEVLVNVAVREVTELRRMRNVSKDSALIPIFKDQRKKYQSICTTVNKVHDSLLNVTDFDKTVEAIHPTIYDWYVSNVLA